MSSRRLSTEYTITATTRSACWPLTALRTPPQTCLARWVDSLADLPRGRGAARALAGLRGVGKSHTLATFAALAALPELRAGVVDAHVATSVRRLLNRHYLVARVQRGTRETLVEEIAAALTSAFGGSEADWQTAQPEQMLAVAASRVGDTTLVLIIDTAFEREERVRRDDGPVLADLARATRETNAFLALALDDDIADAEGVNAALAGTYQIDYLDPEHLYRIADIHLFHKNAHARAALHDIYTSLRTHVPGFNWSEPRFTSIYPVHPLVADVASAVRLYVSNFAFLPFAAEAVGRATSRPALSLIVLDEVFDRTEDELRKAEDLHDAFTAYDQLMTTGISRIPVMQRLQAKLLLKGLFILSLDGRGATPRELGAAMLIYDEQEPEAGIKRIEEMLKQFAEAAPSAFRRSEDKTETRYRFNISTSDAFDEALAEAAARITPGMPALENLLHQLARSRFEDWPFAADDAADVENPAPPARDFTVMWRGMGRRGQLIWQAEDARANDAAAQKENVAAANDAASQVETDAPVAADYDWVMTVLAPRVKGDKGESTVNASVAPSAAPVRVAWKPAQMTGQELEMLRRLIALRTDPALATEFGETTRAAERTHTGLAERIWTRLYMDDAVIRTERASRPFTGEARSERSLAGALSRMLHPLFGSRYPQHPVFTETLTETEVARLVGGFFGGVHQSEASLQELAGKFAAPLGLVSQRNDAYILEAGDSVLKHAWVREVLSMTDGADGAVVPLEAVSLKLKDDPYGLQSEAQHLILAALVAQRRIELVTATGDRIGRRTLDLKLRWDEISGVARAAALLHTAEELTEWARRLTNATELASIADPLAREAVRAALKTWLEAWRGRRLLEKFDTLPDEGLTTRAWNLAQSVRKTFGVAAESIEAALDQTISLEEGLQRVADAFADSFENFQRGAERLAALSSFTNGLEARTFARTYLLLAEPTSMNEIESARRELLGISEDVHSLLDHASCQRFDLLFREFQTRYAEHYSAVHDETVGARVDRRAVDELLRGEEWREFEALKELSILNTRYAEDAARLVEQSRNARCELPVRRILSQRPSCDCAFRLTRAASLKMLPRELEETIEFGRAAARRTLMLMAGPLSAALASFAQEGAKDEETTAAAHALSESFAGGDGPTGFSHRDVRLIEEVLQRMAAQQPVRVRPPVEAYGLLTREDLRARLEQWLDELPGQPALVEVMSESD